MPAIPIFKDTPINASKASGATPQTEEPHSNVNPNNASELSHSQVGAPVPAPALAPSSTSQQPYPPAQPGATPSLPVQTASAQAYPAPRPTPTQRTDDVSPPPPQPGAAPVPVAGIPTLPPPPKAGEAYHPPAPTPATQVTAPYPPQMGIPPPTMSHSVLRGSSTSTANGPQMTGPRPIALGGDPASSLEHPPGYQQDVSASEFSSHQRAAHQAAVISSAERGFQARPDEGVWDTAKKWAQAAGGSLAAAEQEVWRRINKD
ncbi:hypothetical protein CH63R_02732 [Colletotrichum higginsianum IMI 349063]|uniref:Uncharacterized protein n=1 Tax=Colletotrichum higginsianum (strain IMI 349063) TaxID=759273 RepID=A0A1B7YPN4_COLHI|nr:hypothetical protein CH63R_02732 [Colletotrichum higginsianum IMI 349063]OBR14006.1 hypothetical protein CH63R_02732 [Colletotrichum higginsianum IMI 349063]